MTQVGLLKIILNTDGKIFKAKFVKRTTGEVRNMVARLGVTKGTTGAGLKYNPLRKGLIVVYDVQKRAFRHISLDGLREVKFNGSRFRL